MSLTPSDYKNAKPFKAFIQQVLPTIYDDSLSYSELLYKVLYNMNLLVENNNLLIEDIQKLYDYTNDYFENLDVQTEIDNKLEQMYQSGQLDELFKKYLDPKLAEQNSILNTQNDKIETLETRMSGFEKLAEGSTTGDAELIDGRIGTNHITYDNIGDAIRGQTEMGMRNITQILGDNLFTDYTTDTGFYFGYTHGNRPNEDYNVTRFRLKVGFIYVISGYVQKSLPFFTKTLNDQPIYFPETSRGDSGEIEFFSIIVFGDNSNIRLNNNNKYEFKIYDVESPYLNLSNSVSVNLATVGTNLDNVNTSCATVFPIGGITSETNKVPYDNFEGIVLTLCNYQTTTHITQLALCIRKNLIYYRNKYANWSKWVLINDEQKVYTDYDLFNENELFKKITCIGDSLTWGQTYLSSSDSYQNYYNYPYWLKQKYSFIESCSVLARPGYSAKEIWDNLASNINQIENNTMVFCLIGTNEGLTDTVETDCQGDDIISYNGNSNTGCYGKIIKTLLNKNCNVIIITPWKSRGVDIDTTKTTCQKLAEKFNCLYVNIDDVFDESLRTQNNYTDSTHLNGNGYNYLSNLIVNGISQGLVNQYVASLAPYKQK